MIHHQNKRRMRAFVCIQALTLCLLAGCGAKGDEAIASLEQLNAPDRKIGMADDTKDDNLVAETLPQAGVEYYKDAVAGYSDYSDLM